MSKESAFKARLPLEVAAAVAEGYTVSQIRAELDITSYELEEVLASDEFDSQLATYGSSVVELWKEHRASNTTGSVNRKMAERLDDYYEELHAMAMEKGSGLKVEKRADILLEFVKRISPDVQSEKQVHMPPSLIQNIAKRQAEYELHIETPTEEGPVGDTD